MSDAENEIELEPEVDLLDDQADEAGFDPKDVNVQPLQESLRSLIDRIQNNELDLRPGFQRNAELWDQVQMSQFIELILIRFPLPAFYFDATDDNCWVVVDGIQRLSAIRKFVLEKGPDRLRLRGLEFLVELNGKTYDDLDRHFQRRINECPVFEYLIMPGTPDIIKISIFSRINSGGMHLKAQEVRNAVAPPTIRAFLHELCADPNFIGAVGDRSKRMADQELVLRFVAFRKLDWQKGRRNIKQFLDQALLFLKLASSKALTQIEGDFRTAMKRCFQLFGTFAFEKRYADQVNIRLKNASLFDAWAVNLANLSEEQMAVLLQRRELVLEKAEACLRDADFNRAISLATQKLEHIIIRHERIKALIEEVLHA